MSRPSWKGTSVLVATAGPLALAELEPNLNLHFGPRGGWSRGLNVAQFLVPGHFGTRRAASELQVNSQHREARADKNGPRVSLKRGPAGASVYAHEPEMLVTDFPSPRPLQPPPPHRSHRVGPAAPAYLTVGPTPSSHPQPTRPTEPPGEPPIITTSSRLIRRSRVSLYRLDGFSPTRTSRRSFFATGYLSLSRIMAQNGIDTIDVIALATAISERIDEVCANAARARVDAAAARLPPRTPLRLPSAVADLTSWGVASHAQSN